MTTNVSKATMLMEYVSNYYTTDEGSWLPVRAAKENYKDYKRASDCRRSVVDFVDLMTSIWGEPVIKPDTLERTEIPYLDPPKSGDLGWSHVMFAPAGGARLAIAPWSSNGQTWNILCSFCHKMHTHSASVGYRASHCLNYTGAYWLLPYGGE